MQIHELNAQECAEILSRVHLGRLGCSRFDQPYIIPIYFSFDAARNCLYALSTVGQKVDWMRENPKVCVEVEDIDDKNHWTTVVVLGRYQELGAGPEHADARRRAERLLQERRESWFPAAAKVGGRERHAMVVYGIEVDRMTGRRADRDRV